MKESSIYNIIDLYTLVKFITDNLTDIYKDDFNIITPKVEQKIIDNLPRYYDYGINLFYNNLHCETINIRFRLIDNGNETITIKCYENDLYNFATEVINLGINKYCTVNSINDDVYHFAFQKETLDCDFEWIKRKDLPLKLNFIKNDKRIVINRKIKSINSPKVISKYVKKVSRQQYINNIRLNDESIVIEFE